MIRRYARGIKISVLTLSLVIGSLFGFAYSVAAQGQETCPQTGDWVKVDDIDAQSYTYNAPSDQLIVEWCYKAGTTLRFGTLNPGQSSHTVVSNVLNPTGNNFQDISHASFRLAAEPTTPVPTEPTPEDPTGPTPPPTEPTPVPTEPTPVPTEPTPVPTEPTPVPTEPTPDDPVGPTPPPTNQTPAPTQDPEPEEEVSAPVLAQSTPAPVVAPTTGATSGPAAMILSAVSAIGLSGLSLGAWLKRRKM